jgi:hypothetical protein
MLMNSPFSDMQPPQHKKVAYIRIFAAFAKSILELPNQRDKQFRHVTGFVNILST